MGISSSEKSPVDKSTLARADAASVRAEADEEVVALLIEHGVGKRGARGDDFDYVALDYAFGLFGIFDLLADGDLAPELG